MNLYNNTIVLTATLYDDTEESLLRSKACLYFIQNALNCNMPVYIVDGWSKKDFLERLSVFPNVRLIRYDNNPDLQKSHANRRRDGLKRILYEFPNIKYIYWTEPEKSDIVLKDNLDKVINHMIDWAFDQVIPTPKPNDDRPDYLQKIELYTTNFITKIATDWALFFRNISNLEHLYWVPNNETFFDYMFGPKIFTKDICERYYLKDKHLKWDGLIIPCMLANFELQNTSSLSISFTYSPYQKWIEESVEFMSYYKEKRLSQSQLLIESFLRMYYTEENDIFYYLNLWKQFLPKI